MSKKDLVLSLERFATSKISNADDLWKLSSFGFRGEALASISAVSKLSITSRASKDDVAYRIKSIFGKKTEVEQIGGNFGTQILVDELFANTPARLKFLKTEAGESSQIKTMLKAVALAHPEVEFRIFQNQELIYFWQKAQSKVDRAKEILGVEKLFQGSYEKNGIKVYSIFCDPHTTAKTSKQIWLFVQNRWVQDKSLQAAVTEAYRNLLMHGEYPIASVWVQTPLEDIDVNIHPTKSQVKFAQPSTAFSAVHHSIRDVLETAPWLNATDSQKNYSTPKQSEVMQATNLSFQLAEFQQTQFAKKEMHSSQNAYVRKVDNSNLTLEQMRTVQEARENIDQIIQNSIAQPNHLKWSLLDVVGQMNSTYILAQSETAMFMIDQHAAHERVAFEKLMLYFKNGKAEVQEFLFPLSIDLSEEKIECLFTQKDDFHKMGIRVEQLGPGTLGIQSAPTLLKEAALVKTFHKIADDMVDKYGSFSFEKSIADICASMACHSVVRAGQVLSVEQMKSLLLEMDQFPLSSFCPHGRPVYIEMSWSQIEKQFGRIV